jgi:hypothetical protein
MTERLTHWSARIEVDGAKVADHVYAAATQQRRVVSAVPDVLALVSARA